MGTTYGQYNPDNTIKQEADVCILTGRFVDTRNSVREKIPGTLFFYRVIDSQYDRVTDELRKEWCAAAPSAPAAPSVPALAGDDNITGRFGFDTEQLPGEPGSDAGAQDAAPNESEGDN